MPEKIVQMISRPLKSIKRIVMVIAQPGNLLKKTKTLTLIHLAIMLINSLTYR